MHKIKLLLLTLLFAGSINAMEKYLIQVPKVTYKEVSTFSACVGLSKILSDAYGIVFQPDGFPMFGISLNNKYIARWDNNYHVHVFEIIEA